MLENITNVLGPGEVFPLLFFVVLGAIGGTIATIAMVLAHSRGLREKRLVGTMIEDMLDRNMTADDIAKILVAWNSSSTKAVEKLIAAHASNAASNVASKPGKPRPSARTANGEDVAQRPPVRNS